MTSVVPPDKDNVYGLFRHIRDQAVLAGRRNGKTGFLGTVTEVMQYLLPFVTMRCFIEKDGYVLAPLFHLQQKRIVHPAAA